MAARTKSFDCVEMKNRIQAALLAEKAAIGEAEMASGMADHLHRSSGYLVAFRGLLRKG